MSKITSQTKYNKTIFMYAASRALERAAYYGMRSIVVLYMVRGALSISEADAMQYYGLLLQGIVVAGVIGALFGDFILGNRKAVLLGTILMSIGLFLLCVPVKEVFYIGIGLIVIGSGLYAPNLLARFGKQFYDKPELTDGGFSILYVMINIGAAIGIAVVSLAGYENYAVGFALCGILMLGSTILSFFSKDNDSNEKPAIVVDDKSNSALLILLTLLAVGLFWYMYEASYSGLYLYQTMIEEFSTDLHPMIWQTLSTGLSVVIGIAFAVIYSFYNFNRALKLGLGFLLAAAGFGVTLFISSPVSQVDVGIMFLSVLLLSISELMMAPVIYGLITKRTNPKYLALLMSLTFVPYFLFISVMPFFLGEENKLSGTTTLKICTSLIALMGIIVLVLWVVKKKKKATVS